MNWYALLHFPTLVVSFLLGLIIIFQGNRDAKKIWFSSICFAVAFWSLTLMVEDSQVISNGLIVSRTTIIGPIWVPFALLMFSLEYPKKISIPKWVQWIVYLFPIMLYSLVFTKYNVYSYSYNEKWTSIDVGLLYPLFTLYFLIFLSISFIIIWKNGRGASLRKRKQIMYLVISGVVSGVFALISNAVFSILDGGFVTLLGPLITLVFLFTMFYSIFKYQFLDIGLIIKKSLIFFFSSTILLTVFGGLVYGVWDEFFGINEYLGRVIGVILVAIASPYVYGLFEEITNRYFFHKRYDIEKFIENSNHELSMVHSGKDIEKILGRILEYIPKVKSLDIQFNSKLSDLKTQVGFPLRSHGEVFGQSLVFSKETDVEFSNLDYKLFEILSQNVANALYTTRLYDTLRNRIRIQRKHVIEKNTEIREATNTLRELDNVKSEFLSIASHQIRTPLSVLRGYLDLFHRGLVGEYTQFEHELVLDIDSNISRLNDAIENMLVVTRSDLKKPIIGFLEEVDLKDIFDGLSENFDPWKTNLDLEITTEGLNNSLRIISNETALMSIFRNIIQNAMQYTPTGHVKISLKNKKKFVVFEVSDTGIGLGGANPELVFGKYVRLHNAKKIRPDGTGIGLFVVRRYIKELGGKITIHLKDHGILVRVIFPMKKR